MNRQQIKSWPQPLRWAAQVIVPTGQHRPHAAVVQQRFVFCEPCGVETAATLHGALVRCTEGHIVPGGGAR